ncbi:MAG: acetyl-CoA hydrolase/transferase C-terminal domain-containing protein [Hyphomonadaceae bacterium]|nr:acetyl-CoA hydrolase/transferase C-terminal domain-containing protein [Hyphomonadaceae bacterium]
MKTGCPEDVLDWLKPGSRVFFQSGPGECQAFIDLFKANPGAGKGVELWSCLIPGVNTFDYGSLPDGPTLVTFMASPTLAPSIASGRTRIDAMPYSEIGVTLGQTDFDLAILHVAPPDAEGLCSFGISAEVGRIVSPRSKQRIAFINKRMPSVAGDALATGDIDLAIEIDEPLLAAAASSRTATTNAFARHAAALVPEYATIQSGIGDAPGVIIAALTSHKRLRIHSGLVTPEYRLLAESGALDPDRYHVAGIAWGDRDFYDWLPDSGITFRSVRETHFHERLASIPNFVSIGSALEVDLEGAINLEWLGDRRVSSVGGAPDFMHGAAASPGGRSIIALPSQTRSGASRIVPRLGKYSIPAALADAIVTEHGVAELRGLSARARADALIAIAAPDHQGVLAAAAGATMGNP